MLRCGQHVVTPKQRHSSIGTLATIQTTIAVEHTIAQHQDRHDVALLTKFGMQATLHSLF